MLNVFLQSERTALGLDEAEHVKAVLELEEQSTALVFSAEGQEWCQHVQTTADTLPDTACMEAACAPMLHCS